MDSPFAFDSAFEPPPFDPAFEPPPAGSADDSAFDPPFDPPPFAPAFEPPPFDPAFPYDPYSDDPFSMEIKDLDRTIDQVLGVLNASHYIFAYEYDPAKHRFEVVVYLLRAYSEFTIKFIVRGGRHYINFMRHGGRYIEKIVAIRFWAALKSLLQAGVDAPLPVFAPEDLTWSCPTISAKMLATLPPPPTDFDTVMKALASYINMINCDIDDPTVCSGCTCLVLVTTKPALMDVVLSPSHEVGRPLFKRLRNIIDNTVRDVATGAPLRFSPQTRTFAAQGMFELIKQLFMRSDDTVRWMLGELSIVEVVETITEVCVIGDTGPYAKPHTVLHLRRQCGLILDHLVKLGNPIVSVRHDWIIDQLMTIDHADHNHQPLTTIVDEVLSHLISESSE